MVDGFRVDLTALGHASRGVRETIEAMNRKPVQDLDCPAEAVGHLRLATTVSEFCDRWDAGISNLADDAEEISGRLEQCVHDYHRTDEAARAHLEGIIARASGEDPAAE